MTLDMGVCNLQIHTPAHVMSFVHSHMDEVVFKHVLYFREEFGQKVVCGLLGRVEVLVLRVLAVLGRGRRVVVPTRGHQV